MGFLSLAGPSERRFFLEISPDRYFDYTGYRRQLAWDVFGGDLHVAPMGKVSDKGFSEWHQPLFGIKLTYP